MDSSALENSEKKNNITHHTFMTLISVYFLDTQLLENKRGDEQSKPCLISTFGSLFERHGVFHGDRKSTAITKS